MQPEPDVSRAKELRPSVAAIITNADGHVLLQRRSDNGLWGLPGLDGPAGKLPLQAEPGAGPAPALDIVA